MGLASGMEGMEGKFFQLEHVGKSIMWISHWSKAVGMFGLYLEGWLD